MSMVFDPVSPPRFLAGTVPSVQAFTIRENPTQQHIIEVMRDWLVNQLIPFVNSNIEKLILEWDENTAELIANWERLSIELVAQVEAIADGVGNSVEEAQAAQAAAEAARDLAALYASQAEEVQDTAITGIFEDISSDFRAAANAVYAPATLVDVINTGRLSQSELDADYLARSVADTGRLSETALDNEYAPRALVDTGRLSEDALDDQIARSRLSGTTVVQLGDSVTRRNGPNLSGGNMHLPANGWFNWGNAALGQRLNTLANFSVSGKRADEVLSEQVPQLLAMSTVPAIVTLLVGANDIVNNRSASAIIADLEDIYDKVSGLGAMVVHGTITPMSGLTTLQRNVMYNVNDWIKQQGITRKGIVVVDWFPEMSDAFGNPLVGCLVDNVHPTTRGAVRMGNVFARVMAPLIAYVNPFPQPGSTANGAANPFKLLGTGGVIESNVTGSIAQDYRGASADGSPVTAVASLSARPDGIPGNWQEVIVSSGNFRLSSGQIAADPGQVWEAIQEIELAPTAVGTTITRVSLILAAAGSSIQSVALGPNPDVADGMGQTLTSLIPGVMAIKTPQITTPVGTTGLFAHVQVYGGTNGAPIKIGRLWMRRVS